MCVWLADGAAVGQEPAGNPVGAEESATTHHGTPADEPEDTQSAGPGAAPEASEQDTWGWDALPALNYTADAGLGLGVFGNIYLFEPGIAPYADAFTVLIQVTTELVQSYFVRWDSVDVGGAGLRTLLQVGLYATVNDNFCGVGVDVSCDPAAARDTALTRGLEPGSRAYDDFVRRYYLLRYHEPYILSNARWRFYDGSPALELQGGWLAHYYRPGTLTADGPYAGSYYTERMPDGEEGLLSTVQVGITVDSRDNEPAPNRGLFAEAAVRGGGPWIGSDWSYLGLTSVFQGYLPLVGDDRLVLAVRQTNDFIHGDAGIVPARHIGGSRPWHTLFGGSTYGRGIRMHRLRGKLRVVGQAELRWGMTSFDWLGVDWRVVGLAFSDAAWVGADWDDLRGDGDSAALVQPTIGGGLRFQVNRNLIVRLEVGLSPAEDWAPQFYIEAGDSL